LFAFLDFGNGITDKPNSFRQIHFARSISPDPFRQIHFARSISQETAVLAELVDIKTYRLAGGPALDAATGLDG
jgi:hypothetical protein